MCGHSTPPSHLTLSTSLSHLTLSTITTHPQVKFNTYVWMVDDGQHRCQPTHVTDVAQAVANSLTSVDSPGKDYYLAGPETVR